MWMDLEGRWSWLVLAYVVVWPQRPSAALLKGSSRSRNREDSVSMALCAYRPSVRPRRLGVPKRAKSRWPAKTLWPAKIAISAGQKFLIFSNRKIDKNQKARFFKIVWAAKIKIYFRIFSENKIFPKKKRSIFVDAFKIIPLGRRSQLTTFDQPKHQS